jgi:fumarylacetoacetate (FAA) hydrolase
MKLASYKYNRDGRLMLVTSDLSRTAAVEAAPTLQAALDNWDALVPDMRAQARELEDNPNTGEAFEPMRCAAPLPRAFQWADGSAYVNHVELVRKARGAEMPESFWTDPLIYQGGSDVMLGPRDPILVSRTEGWGVDFEAEIAVILGDTPMGVSAEEALRYVRLITIVNDVSLRGLIPGELAKGFGFFQSKPPTAFAPVAITPDEAAPYWQKGTLERALDVRLNGEAFGRARADKDMTFSFAELIAHAARTRPLTAGTIIGSGTISNKGEDGGPGAPVSEGGAGYSCLAEIRTVETLKHGEAKTPFLAFGDRVEIDMTDDEGRSLFGTIDQQVTRYEGPNA